MRRGHLTAAQKRAYIIADNQRALRAGGDATLLAEELAWLRDETFDLDLLGFDAGELEALLAPTQTESDAAEDEAPEPPVEPVSRPGDLWLMGDHRLLCGDATVLATSSGCWTAPSPTWPGPIPPTTSTTATVRRTSCAARTGGS